MSARWGSTVVVSPTAALMKDRVIAVTQATVRAAYVDDAKEDAEVAKDKHRKLLAGSPQT